MRERNLRKQALQSDKKPSRKALSKQGTPAGSRAGSTVPSPRGSRNGSDEEDSCSDGGSQWGTSSIDASIEPAIEDDGPPEIWISSLDNLMDLICDRKGSSAEGRADTLNRLVQTLSRHYARDQIKPRIAELLPVLCKSIKNGQIEREVVLALRALALMLITEPDESIYDSVARTLKAAVSHPEHPRVRIAAVRALSVATFYGGASEEEMEEVMDDLLDIVSSDGEVVGALDDAELVTAALEEWGFLATQIDDMEAATEVAMDTFVDQLESSDPKVQIAAGENIALLFEKSYTEAESDDEIHSGDETVEKPRIGGPCMIKRYTVHRQIPKLTQTLTSLAKISTKRLSKQDKKSLHQAFADILITIEKPTRGPRYSTALDDEGREYGSRLRVAIPGGGGGGKMTIDTWWKLHRLNALKRLLQGGFLEHYENNEVVLESLPVMLEG